MDIFQSTQDLVREVADVVVAQFLRLEELVHVALHQGLDQVQILSKNIEVQKVIFNIYILSFKLSC